MKITKSKLHGWSACNDGYEWFLRRFPDGEADYQDVLNALVEDGQLSYAHWLINHAGPDYDAVLEVDGIADCKNFFAAGRLVIKTRATVTGWLRAGLGIESGEGIEAGEGIKAGLGIEAGCGIKAGLGIEAGWLRAGLGIEAGEGIEAGKGIKAGDGIKAGCGIKAGLGIEAGEGIEADRKSVV